MYELPTIGERGNRFNPLQPKLSEGPRTDFITIEYFEKDTKVKLVGFGDTEEHFKAYEKGKRLPDKEIPEGVIRRTADKDGLILDSIIPSDIGKHEDFKNGGVKSIAVSRD